MFGKDFLRGFKKPEEEVKKQTVFVVEVDKNFFEKLKKEVLKSDDNLSRFTRGVWREFIAHPEFRDDFILKESLKPKDRKKVQRVTLTVNPELYQKIKETAKNADYSVGFITRRLWAQWLSK